MRIAVIGLGRMGLPIARRLAARHEVVGVDPSAGRRALAAEHGIRADPDAASVVDPDVVLTVLPGPGELRELVMVAEELPRSRSVWIDTTSCDPGTGAELHAIAEARGVLSVAAPMQGGPADAEAGSLGFHLAGGEDAVRAAGPVLAALGPASRLHLVGAAPADAYLTKLLGNLLWFGQVAAVTEALLLAARAGLDPARARSVLAAGPGGSEFLRADAGALLRGETMDQFGVDRVVEELRHLTALAEASGLPFEVSSAVVRIHEAALAEYGPRDGELLASSLLQRRAGIDLAAAADSV